MKSAVPIGALLIIAITAGDVVGQAMPRRSPPIAPASADLKAREATLKDAINAEPGDLKRYFALAEFYQEHERPGEADATLRNAFNVDPGAVVIFDKRLGLWLKPLQVRSISAVAQDWLNVDAINPVPVLLMAGHYLRAASASRGDGSDKSFRAIENGLRIIDGALPANGNSNVPALLFAKSALLMAWSTLVVNADDQRKLVEEAQQLHQQATEPPPGAPPPPPFTGAAAAALGVMSVVPPFGPPGAVRAPDVVPRPKKIKNVQPVLRDRRAGRPPLVELELVIDPSGRVIQIHILQSSYGYDDVVANAVQQWEFEPTLLKGQPTSVILNSSVAVW